MAGENGEILSPVGQFVVLRESLVIRAFRVPQAATEQLGQDEGPLLLHGPRQIRAGEQLREEGLGPGVRRRRLELLLGRNSDLQKHFQRRLWLPNERQSVSWKFP